MAPPALEPAAQAFVEATAEPPYPFQVDPGRGSPETRCAAVRRDGHAGGRRGVGHGRRGLGRDEGGGRQTVRRCRDPAGRSVHPWRRLGVRQCAHARPTRLGASGSVTHDPARARQRDGIAVNHSEHTKSGQGVSPGNRGSTVEISKPSFRREPDVREKRIAVPAGAAPIAAGRTSGHPESQAPETWTKVTGI
jgi:hypothetical protein